ncbi:MAG: DUF502 domain-containing protein [Neisseriaceae bacterium]|nr:DUF502 domain-containing protein [Neisseriaceae bacterium]
MAETQKKQKISFKLKKYLITGVLVWLPIIAGIWTINYIITQSDHLIRLIPNSWQPKTLLGFDIPGLGIILALLILLITGLFASNFIGRKIIKMWDEIFGHIPVVKTVYSSVKKVSQSLLSDSRQSFKIPLLVQFPHQGVWTIAFVSGSLSEEIIDAIDDDEYLSVYVPTTPNPTGGYYIFVRKKDTRPIDMSVDSALKYIISLGMVMPDKHNLNVQENSSNETNEK